QAGGTFHKSGLFCQLPDILPVRQRAQLVNKQFCLRGQDTPIYIRTSLCITLTRPIPLFLAIYHNIKALSLTAMPKGWEEERGRIIGVD
ncbi:MAG: hypothetical protein LBQ73_11330, partial [Tannerellaceae bacterium]|nr:hypothetical protein [Tannerellaceae bacterium]